MTYYFKAPFLPPEKIKKEADIFLDKYHPTRNPPIPIEYIAESKLRMEIVPIPNLRTRTGIESMLLSDLKTIVLDEYLLDIYSNGNRYRYSLAHEIAHLFLHREIVKEFGLNDTSALREFMTNVDSRQYGWLETHANEFAGLILVPPEVLEKSFKSVCSELKKEGYSPSADYSIFGEYLIERLAKKFQVSPKVMEIRIRNERLSME